MRNSVHSLCKRFTRWFQRHHLLVVVALSIFHIAIVFISRDSGKASLVGKVELRSLLQVETI